MSTVMLEKGTEFRSVRVRGSSPVLALVDDDSNAHAVLRRGVALAAGLGVSLRAAYVWSDCRPPDCSHHRRCHRDLGGASRLLTELINTSLSVEDAARVERDVIHGEPAEELVAITAAASVVVVGSSSDRPTPREHLGDTARALLDRTQCPIELVPYRSGSVSRRIW